MKKYDGMIEPSLITKFTSGYPENGGFHGYVSNCVGLEGLIACASFFSPEIIEHQNCVLLGINIDSNIDNISIAYGEDKESIEKYNNLICLTDFFLEAEDDDCFVEELMLTFGELLSNYWQKNLQNIFPNKKFEFILSNDLYDEEGLCLTFFEL